MDVQLILILAFGLAVLGLVWVATWLIRQRSRIDKSYFQRRWQDILKLCANEPSWMQAVIEADILMDEALKKRHFKGTSTGQRLADAARIISDPDAVWQAHKLRNRLTHESGVRLTKNGVIRALEGFRGALKDLGAIS